MALALATFALSWQPSVAAQPVVQRCNRAPSMMVNPMQQRCQLGEGGGDGRMRSPTPTSPASALRLPVSRPRPPTLKSIADKPTDYGYSVAARRRSGEVGPADFV